jgi:hypothetical protein
MNGRAGSYSVRPLGLPDASAAGVVWWVWWREANERGHMARARKMPGWKCRKGKVRARVQESVNRNRRKEGVRVRCKIPAGCRHVHDPVRGSVS